MALDGLNCRVTPREFIYGYLANSAIMAPLLVQSIITKCFLGARFGWFQLSCHIAWIYLPMSAIMATLLVQWIIKKCLEDGGSGWFKLSCHTSGDYLRLSCHFCNYGTFIGPIDSKEVLLGRSLWMVSIVLPYCMNLSYHVCKCGIFIVGVPTFRERPVFRISGSFTLRVWRRSCCNRWNALASWHQTG